MNIVYIKYNQRFVKSVLMLEIKKIHNLRLGNQNIINGLRKKQSNTLGKIKDLQKLLDKFDKQLDNYKINQSKIKKITYIDLFCGLGAFHTAFNKCSNNKINYKCVYACDIDANARKLYYENYNITPDGDINKVIINNIPDFDILCAGFPCQPFSIAGKQEGFSDKNKGNLFKRILQIIDIKKPKIVFLENVKNLHTINDGETFKVITDELTKRDYKVSYKVLDSKYYNSPQSRKRIYIICSREKIYKFKQVKLPIRPVSSIIDTTENNFFDYTKKYKLVKCTGNSTMIYKLINKITKKGGRQGERVYDINKHGPTICASSGGPGAKTGLYLIDNKIRTLNIKETLQMFGFNIDYKYSSLQYEKKILFHLGNSIVVNVLEHLISELYNIL